MAKILKIADILSDDEKKLLRKKKKRQDSLLALDLQGIKAVLEVSMGRTVTVFESIHQQEMPEKDVKKLTTRLRWIDGEKELDGESDIKNLGIGLSAAVNQSLRTLGLASSMSSSLEKYKSMTTIPGLEGLSNVRWAAMQSHDFFQKTSVIQKVNWTNLLTRSSRLEGKLLSTNFPGVSHLDFSKSAIHHFALANLPGISGVLGVSNSMKLATEALTGIGLAKLSSISKVPTLNESFLTKSHYTSLGIASMSYQLTSMFKGTQLMNPEIGIALSNVATMSKLAENSLSGVQWSSFGKGLNGVSELVKTSKIDFLQLTADYSKVLKSIEMKPNWVYDTPDIVKLPADSYYTQSRLVEVIADDEFQTTSVDNELEGRNADTLERLLHQLNPGMVKMWKGALESLHGSNSDYVRHFTTSVRELYNHLLRTLAPEKELRKWDTEMVHFDNNKPSRHGRLLYINRKLEGSKKEFAGFLAGEVKTALDLMELLNGGTHGIDSSLSHPQLIMMKIKAEQIFVSLLQIEFSVNRAN